MRELTARQKAFVVAYLSNGMIATRAAIEAGFSEKSAPSYAARLVGNPAVQRAIALKQDEIADVVGLTPAHHIRELEKLRDAAVQKNQMNAAVTAEVQRGTVAGFYRGTGPTGQQQAFVLNIEGL